MNVDQIKIPISDTIFLLIYSSSAPLYNEPDASEYGESRWQLLEGKVYDYEIIDHAGSDASSWEIIGPALVFQTNAKHKNRGKIITGIYVGSLEFKAVNTFNGLKINLCVEIRSVKAEYRTDYRNMLEDITKYYTDLVMAQDSPISQTFEVSDDASLSTLYQKFSFLKGIIDNDTFDEAIHKILANPVRRWTDELAEKRIESVKKLDKRAIRQIASRANRFINPNQQGILDTLPRTISVLRKVDTVDTHENQFIKFALSTFFAFCGRLASHPKASASLINECESLCEKLASYLNGAFFLQVNHPTTLDIGSPVLQRKEGYREILQAWLMFDLSAKITWTGGDDVYNAGKKNVAVLYEYWLFFKLMELISSIFEISPQDKRKLVYADDETINLDLKQGKTKVVSGKYDTGYRYLNINFFYNRTFGYEDDIYKSGSWTMSMRPDYTLSIWPGDKTEEEAERDDMIVHIHFDAKYRLDKILLDDKNQDNSSVESELADEKVLQETDTYKRGDLLKMHAYKDAIRRTAGAYVLYPGRNLEHARETKKGFHEIIPGLGAFCIAPGPENLLKQQLRSLEDFIREVIRHFENRTSQREKVAVSNHAIHMQDPPEEFYYPFPQPENIDSFPDAIPVLVGVFRDEELDWIHSCGKYCVSIDKLGEKNIKLDSLVNAKYLALFDSKKEFAGFYKIMSKAPTIVSSEILCNMQYPASDGNMFLLYDISKDAVEDEIKGTQINIGSMIPDDLSPFVLQYINLFPSKYLTMRTDYISNDHDAVNPK